MLQLLSTSFSKDIASDAELLGIFEQLLLVHSRCAYREGASLGTQHHRHDALVAATGFLLPKKMVGMVFFRKNSAGPQHKWLQNQAEMLEPTFVPCCSYDSYLVTVTCVYCELI